MIRKKVLESADDYEPISRTSSPFSKTFDSTFSDSHFADKELESLESLPASASAESLASGWQPLESVEGLKSQLVETIGSGIESATSESSPQPDRPALRMLKNKALRLP